MNNKNNFRIALLIFFALFLTSNIFSQTELLSWNFSGINGAANATAGTVVSGISTTAPSAVITCGQGINADRYGGNSFGGYGITQSTLEEAIDANDYLSFRIAPENGKQISIQSIKMKLNSQTQIRSFAVFSSLGGFTIDKVIGTLVSNVVGLQTLTISNHDDIVKMVEFRVYIYGATDMWTNASIGEYGLHLNTNDLVLSGIVEAASADILAPSVPKNLSVSNITTKSCSLSWSASSDNYGVTGYEIFKNGNSIGTTTNTNFVVSGLTSATTFQMTVKAKDAADNFSEASTSLDVATKEYFQVTGVLLNKESLSLYTGATYTLIATLSPENASIKDIEWKSSNTNVATVSATGLVEALAEGLTNITATSVDGAKVSVCSLNVTTQPEKNKNKMGIGLEGVTDYAESRIFADAMITGRGWKKIENQAVKASLDANGWPTEDAEIIVFHGFSNPQGTYKLSFTGKANITFGWGGASINNQFYDAATNTTTADIIISPSNALYMRFAQTNGGIKNVKLMRPLLPGSTESYPVTATFTNEVKQIASKFSVVRFMDFTATNTPEVNLNGTWAERTQPSYFYGSYAGQGGYQGKGVAWEYAIQFCNETNTDAWINVPYNADDNYITQLANLFKNGGNGFAGLNSNLKLYVEYGNELWNYAFKTTQNLNAKVKQEIIANPNSPLNYDGSNDIVNGWMATARMVGKRTVEISKIFRSVFGDNSMMTRIRPVAEWQLGNAGGTAIHILDMMDSYYNNAKGNFVADPHPVNYYIYGGGGSAYYGTSENDSPDLTLDTFFETMDTLSWKKAIVEDMMFCSTYGIKRIAYEGGPSLDRITESNSPVKSSAFDDPRMKQSVIDHHQMWNNYNGDLLVYFTIASNGNDFQWAFTRNIFDPTSQKLQAIDYLNTSDKSPVTYGKIPPFSVESGKCDFAYQPWAKSYVSTQKGYNDWLSYIFKVETSGIYTFQINYTISNASSFDVYYDGVFVATEVASVNGLSKLYTFNNCTEGLHAVRLVAKTGQVNMGTANFAAVEDKEAPAQPTGLEINNISFNSFDLSWNASTDNIGVAYYEVFKDDASIGTTTTTSFNINGLSCSTSYSLTIVAVDGAGNRSIVSPIKILYFADCILNPTSPTDLVASSITTSSFTLSWGAATDVRGVAYYEVYKAGVSIGTTVTTSYNVTGLSENTDYTMTVKAINDSGYESDFSTSIDVQTKSFVGIIDINNGKLSVYPNPANDFITVSFDYSIALVNLYFRDLQGRTITALNNIESGKPVNISILNKGFYLLEIQNKNYSEIKRLIIQK